MSKEAYWFKHDSNAKDDPKIIILIEELGLEGYGIFWLLVETLRNEKDFMAPLRIIPALARRYNTSNEKIMAVITRYDLFVIKDDKVFYSPSLIERMVPLLEKKKKLVEAGKKGAKKRWKNSDKNSVANSQANSNNRIVNKRIPNTDQVVKYFHKNGYEQSDAILFFEYYNDKGWKDALGNEVKNWKLKAQKLWFPKIDKQKQSSLGLDEIQDGGTF